MFKIAQSFKLRITLSFTISASLLLLPNVSLVTSDAAQEPSETRKTQARWTRPEGTLPDLENIKGESNLRREPAAPIPSSGRSRKNEGKPWDGRRVGEPFTPAQLDQVAVNRKPQTPYDKRLLRRAHARKRLASPPSFYEYQFIDNFFSLALLRAATSEESLYWIYQLRAAQSQGATSVKLAATELGRTLFESASYAARNRNAHDYVYDLYKTYLMRDPDAGGWATWEALVSTHGRTYVRRGFEESGEFATLVGSLLPSGGTSATASSLVSALVDPANQPGNGMLTRDASWSVSLLNLPGRNGLNLGLTLSYSSMVWTRSGPYYYFDEDNGSPSPGFRLGFPTVQRKAFDAQTGKNSYLLLTPSGNRVDLRQVGSSAVYEAADSSYLQLTENVGSLLVRSTDGTQLTFVEANNEYRCTQLKDRNGNYITVNYNSLGRINTITDTLGRVITFNYDTSANLLSITQAWNGQPSHQWVGFGWSTRNMQYSFSSDKVIGTKNGEAIPVITQVTLNDTSHYTFEYTNPLQVSQVKNYFGTLERNATTFTYQTASGDVPRLSSSSVSAHNWSGYNNVPAQVTTQYSVAGDGACVLTAPDGTVYKTYYGTGWQKGLVTATQVEVGGLPQKWTTTNWTQDNESVSFPLNPRVTATNVHDAGSHRRTTIHYSNSAYAQYGLPYEVREYAADASTIIRQTFTDYNLSQAYLDRRIIGLASEVHVTNGSQFVSKTTYAYDDPTRLQALPNSASATQHDTAYSTSLTARGNLTSVSSWDVTDITNASKTLTSHTNYYVTGTPASTADPVGHGNSISYADVFSDGVSRTTFAYPTTVTDAANNSSYARYNFDFGAITRTESPVPAGQSQGAIQTITYNNLGQLEKVTTTNNGAYKRFWYGAEFTASYATVNNAADELYSTQVTDGHGRVIGALRNHPGSNLVYSLVHSVYDQMGRTWLQSNPAEVNSSWSTTGGDDAAGIYYTQQTYDWQGRPLTTTNPDLTTKTASYSGCGCAGGSVVTLTDEGTIDGGITKRRQQKIYSDVLGRKVKTERLNWQNGSPYSTVVNSYNALDQVTQVRQYAGPEGSGTYQDTTMSYDGYGRLKTKHVPEQSAGANTVWDYNLDGTVQKITDGRGATKTYAYNSRHLVTGISYGVPSGSQIPVPGAVTYGYDAASNRTSMADGTGTTTYSYDELSRMTSESRTFSGFSGTYALNYSYNLANALSQLSIPFKSQQIGYNYDSAGRLSAVTASGFSASAPNNPTQSLTSFASNIAYRAWGERKSMTYGNTTSEQITYTARLQPATYTLSNMNYQNTNICCSYPTYSTMTWNFGYYDDGRLKHAWDSTNEWFDRSYKYDHAGRLSEASTFRRARGLSPFPSIAYPDPYHQVITYDAFHHTNRTGKMYTGEPSDIGTYANNRRTDSFWQYDADGNNTRNASYQDTFDAGGEVMRSVSHEQVGDGSQYPFEPQLDIAQTYDGSGAPAKREQITRTDALGGQPVADSQTTYFVRSSVLGRRIVAELGGANTVHIYAGGQRIAREEWGSVTFEHHNPQTGSWVTSNGHPNSRLTGREERDPRGAEMPLSNPYSLAQSYVDWRFGEQLFIEGGNPFDYSAGYEIDGVPVTETEFRRRAEHGSVDAGVFIGGRYVGSIDLSAHTTPGGISVRISIWEHDVDLESHKRPNGSITDETPEAEIETVTIDTKKLLASFIVNASFGGTQNIGRGQLVKAAFSPQQPAKPQATQETVYSQLNGAQCDALRKLLKREAELGTSEAAARSQITYPYPNNDLLINPFNSSANPNIVLDDGTQIDLDWWTTLAGLNVHSGTILLTHNVYLLGKTSWSIAKRSVTGNPVPYQDPGERWAVMYSAANTPFSDVFDEKFMNRECGPNSRRR